MSFRELFVFTAEEEKMVVSHVMYKASIGYGDSWNTLWLLLQQVLTKITIANPQQVTGLEEQVSFQVRDGYIGLQNDTTLY